MATDEVVLAVDETYAAPPSRFAAVCVVVIDDVDAANRLLTGLRDDLVGDPYYRAIPSVGTSLAGDGFHYAADSPDVRRRAFECLQGIDFEGYIAFSEQMAPDPGHAWYDRLLSAVLPDRLAEQRHRDCRIVAEAHGAGQRRLTALQALVDGMVARLETRSGQPFRSRPTVSFGTKAVPFLAVPDYLAGCFRKYWLEGQRNPGSLSARHFRELWSRLRLVMNVDSGTRYWRHQPLPGFE